MNTSGDIATFGEGYLSKLEGITIDKAGLCMLPVIILRLLCFRMLSCIMSYA